MQTPAISVIVPIYKVEKYLRRCLDSAAKQTFQDFEVIMIDDGSPDNSAEIALSYTDDPRFRLIRQENSGVGAVRNKGIREARGEYIAFFDGDDALAPDHLEKLYSAAKAADADVVCCGYCCCDENGEHLRSSKITHHGGVFCTDSIMGAVLRDISIRSYLWSKLWRKSLFTRNNVFFPKMTFEDAYIIPILFYYSERIAVISDRTYIYTCRNNSITGLTDISCIGNYLEANRYVEDFFVSAPEADFYRKDLVFRRIKTVLVTFCWLFVRVWRARTLEGFGYNLGKIAAFAVRKNSAKATKPQRKIS